MKAIWMKTALDSELSWDIPNSERLLTLLLIVLVGVGSAANQVHGRSIAHPFQNANVDTFFNNIFNRTNTEGNKENSSGVTTQIRKQMLYNTCSERFIKIMARGGGRNGRKGVNARGKWKKRGMKFSKLVLEPTPSGTIKIWGQHTTYYLCFNRKGNLITRRKGNRKSCEFKEVYSADRHYTQYQTADSRHKWKLGFRKNGKPLKGSAIHDVRKQDCFKFLKYPSDVSAVEKKRKRCKSSEGPFGVDFCDNKILDLFKPKNKLRHGRQHKRRRKG